VLDLQERVRASLDAEARQTITAPTAGEVVGLKFTNVGTVIGPREPIMDLVPADRPLEVEARIRPEDINYVQVGASADLRLIAFKQRITPLVLGTVTYVSADRVEDTVNRSAYYVAHIQVRPQQQSAAAARSRRDQAARWNAGRGLRQDLRADSVAVLDRTGHRLCPAVVSGTVKTWIRCGLWPLPRENREDARAAVNRRTL
jgi:HlyD family secretion protein